ncbi:extended synaptotagmin-2-A-like [Euwallacea similis]|uniref:extended synaptotagmin-2-A-like n=1 Tax=Euwallacea similis TaxID=1736056 RepID=UPI00344D6199
MEIYLGADILSKSKIKLTLRYSVQKQRLIVVVHNIEYFNNFKDLHFDEPKGIYVKLYLLPERHTDTKRKTQVIKTTKNPVFDETFEFVISQDELNQKHLEVSVCEERVIKNEDLEKVIIDLEKLGLVLPYTKLFTVYKKSHES